MVNPSGLSSSSSFLFLFLFLFIFLLLLLADEQNVVDFGMSLAQKHAFPEGGTKLEWVRKTCAFWLLAPFCSCPLFLLALDE